MRVPARNNQGEHGETEFAIPLLPLFKKHRVNVAFKVIDSDEGLIERKG
jgi:hypothetical protein